MNETEILLNITAPVFNGKLTTKTIVAKDMCYGTLGVNILLMTLFLLGFNFFVMFFWNKFCERTVRIFNKEYHLVFFVPLVNWIILIFIFVYVYNAW